MGRVNSATFGMNSLLLANVRMLLPGEGAVAGRLLIKGGKIAALNPPAVPDTCEVVDGRGHLLTPGLIDMHTHGIGTWLYEQGPAEMLAGGRRVASTGTTTFLPTVVPRRDASGLRKLEELAAAVPGVDGACVPGLHLEGPFMAIAGAACEPTPGDLSLLDDLIAACGRRVAVMSLSPDTPGIIPVIERLVEYGIVPFVTHTRADVEQAQAAIEAGARHATHFYDVFPPPPERDPGVRPAGLVEAFLADPRATVDFIADGCHVDPVVIRLTVRAKGAGGVSLITDSNIGAGLPPGEYPTPWGYPVRIGPGGGTRIADPSHALFGALAGSALTMDRGMANLLDWLDLPAEQIWAMGTANPARVLGLAAKGRLASGADADLVLWDEARRPITTWVGGRVVYEAKGTES